MQPAARGMPKNNMRSAALAVKTNNASRPTTPTGATRDLKPTPPPGPWPDPKELLRRGRAKGYDSSDPDAPNDLNLSKKFHSHGKGGDHESQFPPCVYCRLNLNTEPLDKSQVMWTDEDTSDASRFVDDLQIGRASCRERV